MIRVSSEGRPRLAPPVHPPHAISTQISQGDESSQEKAKEASEAPGEKVGAQDGRAEGSLPLVTQPGVPVSSRLQGVCGQGLCISGTEARGHTPVQAVLLPRPWRRQTAGGGLGRWKQLRPG